MAKLLLNFRNVTDEEIDEVRALLTDEAIDYYETQPNRWGLSVGAIWLRDDTQYERARELLRVYGQERQQRERARLAQEQREGRAETVGSRFRANPGLFLACLVGIGFVLYLMLTPFLRF